MGGKKSALKIRHDKGEKLTYEEIKELISGYEICQKPIEGSISDVIHNPEKYGYPNETICSRRDFLGH